MNAVDTNVLIYRFDFQEPKKQPLAEALLARLAAEGQTRLLWQAAGELLNQLSRWVRLAQITPAELQMYFAEVRTMFPIIMPTPHCLDRAPSLAERHTLSHWDSMLVAACLEAGVTKLYTEDMGAPRKIDALELINPFLTESKAD